MAHLDSYMINISPKNLLLRRHGQYNLSGTTDQERSLTELGKQQAAVTAARCDLGADQIRRTDQISRIDQIRRTQIC